MLRNQTSQRILIFGASIFEEGIEHLLKNDADLQVLGRKYTNDIALLDDIARNRPNVIVLNESTPLNTVQILEMLYSIPSLHGLRIVIVRPGNNTIDVYSLPKKAAANRAYMLRQFTVTRPDELVSVVRG